MNDDNYVTKDELAAALNKANSQRSLLIILLLWFFLGGLGAHRLYMGKYISAAIMAVLTILGFITLVAYIGIVFLFIVTIWWFVDLVLIILWSRNGSIS